MKSKPRVAIKFCLSLLLLVILACVFRGNSAAALSSTFPDNNDITTVSTVAGVPTTNDMFVDVSYPSPGGGLLAPAGTLGVYMDASVPPQDILIISAMSSNACAGDSGSRPTGYWAYYIDNRGIGVPYAKISASSITTCDYTIPAPTTIAPGASSLPAPTSIGNKQFYLFYIAYFNDSATQSFHVNSFKVQINKGTVAYTQDLNPKFSLQDRAATGSCDPSIREDCRRSTFKLYFGTSCDIEGTDDREITWFDDDGGAPGSGTLESTNPSGQGGIRMSLFDETANASVPITAANGAGDIARYGPSVGGTTTKIRFYKNHKYRMEWQAVSRSNGIQFQLPYHGIFHDVDCQSTQGMVNGNCNAIYGWAVDGTSPSTQLQVDIYTAGINVSNIVGMAGTPSGKGYWLVGADGGIFTFGDANYKGSAGQVNPALPPGGANSFTPTSPIVGITATPSGNGYWMVGADGGIFTFGDAAFFGSKAGSALGGPIVGMARTPSGGGYWLVGANGAVFRFGDAVDYNNAASFALAKPIVGMAATPDGGGYWLVGGDGGIFAFGNAVPRGNTAGTTLTKPIVGMAATPDGGGYWLVGGDGGIFAFGNAPYITPGPNDSVAVVTQGSGGYWTVAKNGYVGAAGTAAFHGSLKEQFVGSATIPPNGDLNKENHKFSYGTASSITLLVGSNTVRFNAYARQPGAVSPTPSGVLLANSPVAITCPPSGGTTNQCRVIVDPTQPEVNTNPKFTMTIGFTGVAPGGTMKLTFTPPSGGIITSPNITPSFGGPGYQNEYNGTSFSQTGIHTVRLDFTGGSFSESCSNTFTVVTKPYARFYGGDVRAGGLASCPGWTTGTYDGDIDGHYDLGTKKGMGVQLAAFAAGNIDGFASAFARIPPTPSPNPPNGLSFANELGGYGGIFAERFCPPDYYDQKPASGTIETGSSLNLSSLNGAPPSPDNNYEFSHTGTLILKQNLRTDRRVAIYVKGDVLIESTSPEVNLDPVGPGGTVDNIPSLYIIAQGNIYLDDGDHDIGGIFIAQPDLDPTSPNYGLDKSGRIYTCSNGLNPPTNIKADCGNKLTVNGALIARQIRFYRSGGTVSAGSAGEPSGSGNIAEAMIFSPDIWLARVPNSLRDSLDEFDAITSLPPIL